MFNIQQLALCFLRLLIDDGFGSRDLHPPDFHSLLEVFGDLLVHLLGQGLQSVEIEPSRR
jgi:hypothetical protein